MKQFLNITVSLTLMLMFSETAYSITSKGSSLKNTRIAKGMNCNKKIKDPLSCMACQVYFESRGEPLAGQLAVAKVTLKRANNNPDYICDKVFEKKKKVCQFSWACDGKSHVMKNARSIASAVKIAKLAILEGPGRFDHFYAEYINEPVWAKPMYCEQTGRHIFCDGTKMAGYKKVPAAPQLIALHEAF